MRKKIQLTPSGISFIDKTWRGFYTGGTYLLIGPRKSGKTLLGLQFTQEAVRQKEVCLYFTSMRPKDLMINAASINFDLQSSMDLNQVIVIRVNNPSERNSDSDTDKRLEGYLLDIISIVEQYQPSKIVFDELTPFVGYKDIRKLEEVFIQTCDAIEDLGITTLFTLKEPVSSLSKSIIDTLTENSTGVIKLEKKENAEGLFSGGSFIISPNIGHIEGEFRTVYSIQPGIGISTEFSITSEEKNIAPPNMKNRDEYKSLAEIETTAENYFITDFYNENEFRLILNSQIAYYKSTGQKFFVCSFLLDEEAEKQRMLSLNQLKNAIRLSMDKKDKICVMDDRIIVLIPGDQKNINNLIARVKSNIQSINKEHLNKILQHISVYSVQAEENVTNADDLLKKILSGKTYTNIGS